VGAYVIMVQYAMKHVKGANSARARLLKLAFESLYGPFAWAYDWVSKTFFLGQWGAWQRSAIPHLTGKRVLEVGMGTGNMQIALTQAGYEAWGVDLSAQMLRQATAKARRHRLPPTRMLRAAANALPFPAGYFDSTVSTFPSEYISDPRTLSELRRVLKPGGRVVVVPGAWLKPKGAHARALGGIARIVYGPDSSPRSYSDEEIQRQLEQSGSWYGWVGVLKRRLEEAGFRVSARVASNAKGSCLIVIGDQTSISSNSPVGEAASQSSLSSSVSR
jgi:ubiquinone/menaquinone biosynthesis C-methylase UbiE